MFINPFTFFFTKVAIFVILIGVIGICLSNWDEIKKVGWLGLFKRFFGVVFLGIILSGFIGFGSKRVCFITYDENGNLSHERVRTIGNTKITASESVYAYSKSLDKTILVNKTDNYFLVEASVYKGENVREDNPKLKEYHPYKIIKPYSIDDYYDSHIHFFRDAPEKISSKNSVEIDYYLNKLSQ